MVILATAQISATSSNGETCLFRALIDQGSQISMISEEAAQILSLPRKRISTELTGLSDAAVGTTKSRVYLEIRPRFMSNNKMQAEFLVLPTLIKPLPDESFEFNKNEWENYTLADPNLNTKDRIDIIIGSDLYPKLIEEGVRKHNSIVGQYTIFGWVVSGSLHEKRQCGKIMSAVTSSMERFWEIEEIEMKYQKTTSACKHLQRQKKEIRMADM
ncbi:uncharacterized protein LOC129905561 [Episyrphus balteatus]|uniref:uncharacterized protein LOC129905561 n=1 Tax=Episyrphus balteatus TaxID=286459 RepID=UPI0024855A5B|nr:uncharacterized protein LOC129905561 [Episyrphus balteatus]